MHRKKIRLRHQKIKNKNHAAAVQRAQEEKDSNIARPWEFFVVAAATAAVEAMGFSEKRADWVLLMESRDLDARAANLERQSFCSHRTHSVFTVRSVAWGQGRAPHRIQIDAASNNRVEAEGGRGVERRSLTLSLAACAVVFKKCKHLCKNENLG